MKDPFSFVLFGAAGDLAARKIWPALYYLYQEQVISREITIIGNSRTERSDEEFRQIVYSDLEKFFGKVDLPVWHHLEKGIFFVPGDANDPKTIKTIENKLNTLEKEGLPTQNRLYYMAIIPEIYEAVLENLGKAVREKRPGHGWNRVMIEKPFGTDFESAVRLNKLIKRYFNEDDVYRMDHFLGKETVQNILAFRFANGLFEPIWNKDFIDNIQISSLESQGIDGREIFYDHTGAIRDVVQNHVLQILAVTLMDIPKSLESRDIKSKSMEIFKNIKPFSESEVDTNVVYGQYGRGIVAGKEVRAYLQEENIPEGSSTETFVALKLALNTPRWKGVPIYIRAGKRMCRDVTEISIQFKDSSKNLPQFAGQKNPNVLTIRIQPDEGIILRFDAKKPGLDYQLQPVNMEFRYNSAFANSPLIEAYRRLISDAIKGDHMLYPNAEAVEATWKLITPILQNPASPKKVETYPAGSMGPEGSYELLKRDNRYWFDLSPEVC